MKFSQLLMVALGLLLASCQNPVGDQSSQPFQGGSRTALPNSAPVVLESARLAFHTAAPGEYIAYVKGVANLKNIAYAKDLTLFYSTSNGLSNTNWYTLSITKYLGQDENGYEQWEFTTPGRMMGSLANFEFALEYKVAGETYWDNNSGRNYNIRLGRNEARVYDGDHGVLNNGPLVLNKIVFAGDQWRANILVKNLAYEKNVQIHYTSDAWATTTSASASYSRVIDTINEIEEWSVSIPMEEAQDIDFYLSYEVNGTTYYDNNFGENYSSDPLWGVF